VLTKHSSRLSEDPRGFDGGTNLYLYAADSPTNFVDPSGQVIVVNGSPQENLSYLTAIPYLQQDPGMAFIIQDLQNSSTVYTINFNNLNDDSFNPLTNVINWDPNSGCTSSTGGTQSPALGLGHELAHAQHPELGNFLANITVLAGNYDNWEEWRVIWGAETDAAHTLGEPTRPDHDCTATPRQYGPFPYPHIPDPTLHTPVVYPTPPIPSTWPF
jgi:hypothetical protein